VHRRYGSCGNASLSWIELRSSNVPIEPGENAKQEVVGRRMPKPCVGY
jgi:hypothetical protein